MNKMKLYGTTAKKILEKSHISASAPCRIDSGGTWDIKAMALPFRNISPVTVNIALNLRTNVTLLPYKNGRIKITSSGFVPEEKNSTEKIPLDTHMGLFFAAVEYFGFHSLEVVIASGSPVRSALGGSSTALTALIKALSKLESLTSGRKGLGRKGILHLGYHLEDGISGGNCGIQDQAAAVYGGVSLWAWTYGNRDSIFRRDALLDRKEMKQLSAHIIVAFSGKSHVSKTTNRLWLKDFLSGKTRQGWFEANEKVKGFAKALKRKEWKSAAAFLMEEMKIRRRITPDALIPVTDSLIKTAEKTGCGARFAGAGAGGSVWAIGEEDQIKKLRLRWRDLLDPVEGACILECEADPSGVR